MMYVHLSTLHYYTHAPLLEVSAIQTFITSFSPLPSPPLPSPPPSRNYHIFYYMLAGASPSLRRQLSLKTVKDYRYLSQGVVPLGDVSEVDEFHRLKRSLAMLGLAEELQNRCVYVYVCVHV